MRKCRVLWRTIEDGKKSKPKVSRFFSEDSAEQFFFSMCRKNGSLGGMMRRRNKRYRYFDEHFHIAKVNF